MANTINDWWQNRQSHSNPNCAELTFMVRLASGETLTVTGKKIKKTRGNGIHLLAYIPGGEKFSFSGSTRLVAVNPVEDLHLF